MAALAKCVLATPAPAEKEARGDDATTGSSELECAGEEGAEEDEAVADEAGNMCGDAAKAGK